MYQIHLPIFSSSSVADKRRYIHTYYKLTRTLASVNKHASVLLKGKKYNTMCKITLKIIVKIFKDYLYFITFIVLPSSYYLHLSFILRFGGFLCCWVFFLNHCSIVLHAIPLKYSKEKPLWNYGERSPRSGWNFGKIKIDVLAATGDQIWVCICVIIHVYHEHNVGHCRKSDFLLYREKADNSGKGILLRGFFSCNVKAVH